MRFSKLFELVDPVALQPGLPAARAPKGLAGLGQRMIPLPDAALGDGISRSAAIAA